MFILGGSSHNLHSWFPATYKRDLGCVPGFWLWPRPATPVANIWGVNQHLRARPPSFSNKLTNKKTFFKRLYPLTSQSFPIDLLIKMTRHYYFSFFAQTVKDLSMGMEICHKHMLKFRMTHLLLYKPCLVALASPEITSAQSRFPRGFSLWTSSRKTVNPQCVYGFLFVSNLQHPFSWVAGIVFSHTNPCQVIQLCSNVDSILAGKPCAPPAAKEFREESKDFEAAPWKALLASLACATRLPDHLTLLCQHIQVIFSAHTQRHKTNTRIPLHFTSHSWALNSAANTLPWPELPKILQMIMKSEAPCCRKGIF